MSVVRDSRLVAEWTAALAASGAGPGTNSPAISTWDDPVGSYDVTLNTFAYNSSSGWSGSGTAGDPYCLTFDGASDYCGDPDLSVCEDRSFSYEVWMKSTSTATAKAMVSENRNNTTQGYAELRLHSGVARFAIAPDSGSAVAMVSVATINDGSWHHVVGTCDGSYMRVYVDGSASGTPVAPPGALTVNRVQIGRSAGNAYYPGSLSVVRIYNAALTADEVAANYAAGILDLPVKTITPSAPLHGSMSLTVATAYTMGTTPTITFTPDAGYYLSTVYVDGVATAPTTATTYVFSALTADHSIGATFTVLGASGYPGPVGFGPIIKIGNIDVPVVR